MFFQYPDKLTQVEFANADRAKLAVGFVSAGELAEVAPSLGFAPSTVAACATMNRYFRSGVEIYDEYTFTELRIADPVEPDAEDDCVALFIRKDLFLVVDVLDKDRSTEQKFRQALRRFPPRSVTLEKLIYAFLDALVARDITVLETMKDWFRRGTCRTCGQGGDARAGGHGRVDHGREGHDRQGHIRNIVKEGADKTVFDGTADQRQGQGAHQEADAGSDEDRGPDLCVGHASASFSRASGASAVSASSFRGNSSAARAERPTVRITVFVPPVRAGSSFDAA